MLWMVGWHHRWDSLEKQRQAEEERRRKQGLARRPWERDYDAEEAERVEAVSTTVGAWGGAWHRTLLLNKVVEVCVHMLAVAQEGGISKQHRQNVVGSKDVYPRRRDASGKAWRAISGESGSLAVHVWVTPDEANVGGALYPGGIIVHTRSPPKELRGPLSRYGARPLACT